MFNCETYPFDYLRQAVCADMRMRLDEDVRGCAMLIEQIENNIDRPALFAASKQLTVTECSRASFSEAVV